MKLEKAIELVKADLLRLGSVDKLDFQDAEELLIEAGKRIQHLRKLARVENIRLLPGETQE